MTGIAKMDLEQLSALLRDKWWEVDEEREEATLDVTLTRSLTGRDFGHAYDPHAGVMKNPTSAFWKLDLSARTAEYIFYEGYKPSGSESPHKDDFERAVGMEVVDVVYIGWGFETETLVRGHVSPSSHDDYRLTRARRNWACDVFVVREGEYFLEGGGGWIRGWDICEPDGVDRSYRVSEEVAERLLAMGDGVAAWREMRSIVDSIEESIGAEDGRA